MERLAHKVSLKDKQMSMCIYSNRKGSTQMFKVQFVVYNVCTGDTVSFNFVCAKETSDHSGWASFVLFFPAYIFYSDA